MTMTENQYHTSSVYSRRFFLASVGTVGGGLLLGTPADMLSPKMATAASFADIDPKLPLTAADFANISLADFTDDELDLPYALAHFDRVANSVLMEGENKGFINIPVWRALQDNKPHNARIMESILTLVFFYTTNRPWNVFYRHPGLRLRIETAMTFWCNCVSADGTFSEYAPQRWALAPTAFGTKFMGETLRLIKVDNATLDEKLLERVRQVDRAAIIATLTRPELYRHGLVYSNQFTNVFAGGYAYLALFPDPELEKLLRTVILEKSPAFQSPCGFYYEAESCDWSYNLGTHQSNVSMILHYTKDTDIGQFFKNQEVKFVDWIAHNTVLEDVADSEFVLNKPLESRKSFAAFRRYHSFHQQAGITPDVSLYAPAYRESVEENTKRLRTMREILDTNWLNIREITQDDLFTQSTPSRNDTSPNRDTVSVPVPHSVPVVADTTIKTPSLSPYLFLHRTHRVQLPTQSQVDQATNLLPFMRKDSFTQQRMDSRHPQVTTFVRRPGYYMIFNSGKKTRVQQRFGIGLIMASDGHSVIWQGDSTTQVDTNGKEMDSPPKTAGTLLEGAAVLVESKSLPAQFFVPNKGWMSVEPKVGIHDVPTMGDLRIEYPLASETSEMPGAGRKTILCQDRCIEVIVNSNGKFAEYLPLWAESAEHIVIQNRVQNSEIRLVNPTSGTGVPATAVIRFYRDTELELRDEPLSLEIQPSNRIVNRKRLFMVKVTTQYRFGYRIYF